MGICRYCGQRAGWFSDTHDECVRKAAQGLEQLKSCVTDAIVQCKKYDDVKSTIDRLLSDSAIPHDQFLSAFMDAWIQGAETRCIAQPISGTEFTDIGDFYRGAGLTQDEIRKTAGFKATVFSFLIWTVLNDAIEPYTGPVRFNLPANEIPVFGIANVLLSEERTTRSYVGGYSGASIRVANGLYYHLGGMRGHRVENTSLQDIDYGDFLMTTEAVYFSGLEHGNSFKLPYNQVLRFQPYSDAIGICKNGAKEKIFAPQQVANCGWFLFNILQALATKHSA